MRACSHPPALVGVADLLGDSRDPQLAADLEAAAQRCQRAAEGVAAVADTPAKLRAAQQLVQPAEEAAAVMQRFWACPEQNRSLQAQLAEAATPCSCANVRCPNALLAGGPAAGEGEGCWRCSGCKLTW